MRGYTCRPYRSHSTTELCVPTILGQRTSGLSRSNKYYTKALIVVRRFTFICRMISEFRPSSGLSKRYNSAPCESLLVVRWEGCFEKTAVRDTYNATALCVCWTTNTLRPLQSPLFGQKGVRRAQRDIPQQPPLTDNRQ